jgi:hypothetical protein
MPDYHTKPVLAVRVPGELQDWARAEAERRGQRLGDFISGLLAAERDGQEPELPG